MVWYFRLHRGQLCHMFTLARLLFVIGLVSACSISTASSTSPTPTSIKTPTREIIGKITEFTLPPPLIPGDIVAGPDGNLWFTESPALTEAHTGKIGRITSTGTLTEFSLPATDVFAFAIIAGPDGDLWFNEGNKIGRITTTGKISEFRLSPNTLAQRIAAGSDGNLWFTEGNRIGRMTPTGKISEFSPDSSLNAPLAITAGPDNNLWFTEPGKIGRITTSGKISEFPLPTSGESSASPLPTSKGSPYGIQEYPFSITAGPDGNLWFAESGTNNGPSKIGVVTPQGQISEFTLPHAVLNSITKGPDGALWFTEGLYGMSETGHITTGGKIGRITTAGKISEFPLPIAGNLPSSITTGTDGALWFTESDFPNGSNGKIGRLV